MTKELKTEESITIVSFFWRGTCAIYDYRNRQFYFMSEAIENVPWEDHPEDASQFMAWLATCAAHQMGRVRRSPVAAVEPYDVEIS